MVELTEQCPKRQNSWGFEALADSFEFDQAHRVALQRNQFPERSFLEEAVHETSNMASGFLGPMGIFGADPEPDMVWQEISHVATSELALS